MRNDYGSLVEAWKVDLIIDRARLKGFREDEIEDAQQEIVLAILDFKYDPNNEAGATEATALTALIDRQLAFILRKQARRAKHEKKYRLLHGVVDDKPIPVVAQDAQQEREIDFPADVHRAVCDLSPFEQQVCAALADGQACSSIAEDVGVSRYELDRTVNRIGDVFRAQNLDAWMCK